MVGVVAEFVGQTVFFFFFSVIYGTDVWEAVMAKRKRESSHHYYSVLSTKTSRGEGYSIGVQQRAIEVSLAQSF